MKRYTFSLFFLLVLIVGLYFEPTAQAIPAAQRDCDTNAVSTSSTSFVLVPNSVVTVDNGAVSRNCVITFSASATTGDDGERVDIAYSVDGGTCSTGNGPSSFHAGIITETHTNVSVRNLSSGTHTIEPCFKVARIFSSSLIPEGSLGGRCLVVECQTQ